MQLQRKSSASPMAGGLTASLARGVQSAFGATMDRRTFLKRSGVGAGAGAAVAGLSTGMMAPAAQAQQAASGGKAEIRRTVCTHCSVGCALDAVVENGVWVRHEPVFDSPFNLAATARRGPRCASTATANTG